jgi:DNA repair exonuclease SbcCD ATPase subunit
MDKVKDGFGKAKEGINDFAETTRLRHEISKLSDRKTHLFTEIGQQVYTARTKGDVAAEVDSHIKEIEELDKEIAHLGQEIARINTQSNAEVRTSQSNAEVQTSQSDTAVQTGQSNTEVQKAGA